MFSVTLSIPTLLSVILFRLVRLFRLVPPPPPPPPPPHTIVYQFISLYGKTLKKYRRGWGGGEAT